MTMRKMKLSILPLAALLLASAACTEQTPPPPSENATAAGEQQEETNKQAVIEFYNAAINEKDFDAASVYLGDRYVQHNPTATDGAEGLRGFIDFLRAEFPEQQNEIKYAYADGDIVILHVHSVREPGTRGRAIVDIFKLEDGKVVEHWDVIQDVPDPAEARNANGMF